MDEDKRDKLVAAVMEQLQSDEENLNTAVDIAIDFSKQNSIAPEILLVLSLNFDSSGTYAPAYVFAKSAANLSEGKTKADAYYNAGLASHNMDRKDEAEQQYKIALALDPNYVSTHYNYGILLNEMGRKDEAEQQYKITLALDPNHVNAHGAYGLLLFAVGKEKKALKEIKIASRLFREKDDNVMEHLALAWLYERYADKYYDKGKNKRSGGYFRKSGKYAGLAGDEYIEASKHVKDKGKSLCLSQGYTLKGRSEIRKLDLSLWDKIGLYIQNLRRYNPTIWRYGIPKFIRIIDGIEKAAGYYKEAAEQSDKEKQQCDACSSGMSILSSTIDYMLDVIIKKEVLDLSAKINEWRDGLSPVNTLYKAQEKNDKGKHFIESVEKLINCVENLEKYKHNNKRKHKRELERCMAELKKVASNIEGPIQEIINDTSKKIDRCKDEQEYVSRGESVSDNTSSEKSGKITWIINNPIKSIITFILAILASVIANNIDDAIKIVQDLLK